MEGSLPWKTYNAVPRGSTAPDDAAPAAPLLRNFISSMQKSKNFIPPAVSLLIFAQLFVQLVEDFCNCREEAANTPAASSTTMRLRSYLPDTVVLAASERDMLERLRLSWPEGDRWVECAVASCTRTKRNKLFSCRGSGAVRCTWAWATSSAAAKLESVTARQSSARRAQENLGGCAPELLAGGPSAAGQFGLGIALHDLGSTLYALLMSGKQPRWKQAAGVTLFDVDHEPLSFAPPCVTRFNMDVPSVKSRGMTTAWLENLASADSELFRGHSTATVAAASAAAPGGAGSGALASERPSSRAPTEARSAGAAAAATGRGGPSARATHIEAALAAGIDLAAVGGHFLANGGVRFEDSVASLLTVLLWHGRGKARAREAFGLVGVASHPFMAPACRVLGFDSPAAMVDAVRRRLQTRGEDADGWCPALAASLGERALAPDVGPRPARARPGSGRAAVVSAAAPAAVPRAAGAATPSTEPASPSCAPRADKRPRPGSILAALEADLFGAADGPDPEGLGLGLDSPAAGFDDDADDGLGRGASSRLCPAGRGAASRSGDALAAAGHGWERAPLLVPAPREAGDGEPLAEAARPDATLAPLVTAAAGSAGAARGHAGVLPGAARAARRMGDDDSGAAATEHAEAAAPAGLDLLAAGSAAAPPQLQQDCSQYLETINLLMAQE